jgi:hypothetical protein
MEKSSSQKILFWSYLVLAAGQFLYALGSLAAAQEKQGLPAGEVKPQNMGPVPSQPTTMKEQPESSKRYFDL